MHLVSFGPPGEERLGLLVGEWIIDAAAAEPGLPAAMRDFLELAGPPGDLSGGPWAKLRRLAADAGSLSAKLRHPRGEVRLGPPVPGASKIVCLGLNYREHAREIGRPLPERPLLFAKAPSALCGPADPIVLPAEITQLDYEVELALVVGRRAKDIPEGEALASLAGYCVMNDVSARDAQFGDGQWFRGKSYDTFAPLGPALVTPEELGDPGELGLTTRVNDDLRQDSRTSDLAFGVREAISYVSRCMTLFPGDVIATGTPGGVGAFMKPPRFLERGDLVECAVERLGKLVNPVI